LKQRKVSKILPRARPAAEPLVLSIDLMESMRRAQTRMMDAQKALLDAQAQAQTLVADAQAQAHRILGDAELQLKRVQLEVDAQIRVQKEQRLREMEGELAALRQGAQQEGREAGRREGFEVGRSEAVASVNVAAGEIVGKLREILEMTQQIKGQELEKIEGELVELSLEIAQKVTHAELKTNPDVVLAIARDCIRKVSERAGIVLKVNRDDLDYVLSRKEEFSALEDLEKLHIHEDARVTRGGVIMETNQGEIDGRLEVQMDKIRDSFHALLEEDSA